MSAHDIPGQAPRDEGLVIGQKLAFAAASLALGISAFISLLGMEKAFLAIAFGVLALRNHGPRPARRMTLARFGLVLGALHIALLVILLIVFREEALAFFRHVERFQPR